MATRCTSLPFIIHLLLLLPTSVVNTFTVIPARILLSKHIGAKAESTSRIAAAAAVTSDDTVVVVGGTSGVGQLVTKKLAAMGCNVRASSRDVARGRSTLGEDIGIVQVDLVGGDVDSQLDEALAGANAVVVSVGTTAFPTIKWRGGNTPSAIDEVAVAKIAEAARKSDSVKKVVLVTSVGVERRNEMPFLVLNLFGVVDAKKAGEDAIIKAANDNSGGGGFEYVVIRPGRLVGGPFTNLDVAKLLQIEGGAENGVTLAKGDALLGDCKRDACAEAVVQALFNDNCKNVAFSIISNEEKSALSSEEWTKAFEAVMCS